MSSRQVCAILLYINLFLVTSENSPNSSALQAHRTGDLYVEQIEETPITTPVPPPPLCPPPELFRPCRCVDNWNGQTRHTLFKCNGTEIKNQRGLEQTLHRISKRLTNRHFDWVHLVNFEEMRKITRNFFGSLQFKNLVLENIPKLQHIHPGAFKLVTNQLRYIYAYNTGLEHYRRAMMQAPFGALHNLTELHIASKSNICPPKEIISPCECTSVHSPLLPFEINRQILQLKCASQRGASLNVKRIFHRLTQLKFNSNISNWYFDDVILRNISQLDDDAFGEVEFAELHIEDSENLQQIPSRAFAPNSTLQKLRIAGTNFASDKLSQTFEAINSLPFLRSLFIWSANFEFVPELSFSRFQPFLKEIVLYGNNIRAIGSHAFSSLSNLEHLRIDGNNIILIDSYAFSTNYTSSVPLHITLVSNNFQENSFAFMAFGGAQRPLHVSFAEIGGCFWDMKHLEQNVFAPFLDKSANRLYLEPECELKCDLCEMKWLIEIPKHAQRRITLLPESPYRQNENANITVEGYVPCQDGGNLFDIYEYIDWDRCNN